MNQKLTLYLVGFKFNFFGDYNDMKAKKGYKRDKGDWGTGKWLKRYFSRRTCRKTCCRNEIKTQLQQVAIVRGLR